MAGNSDTEIVPSNQLVRSFSDDLERRTGGDTLARGLAAKVSVDRQREINKALQNQWNHFLVEGRDLANSLIPDEETLLRDQSRKLYEAWNNFCKRLPDEQRRKACTEMPSLRLLHESVRQAAETWEQKRGRKTGRAKRIFTRLCETFQSHSNFMSMLPTDNAYVTLLTGSLTVIAQASINHQELAEGVSSTLEELSQDMAYWNDLISEYSDTKILHRYIRDLYVVVFEFLTDIFSQWSRSSWRRFLTSFDEEAFKKLFSDRRDRIKAIEQRMKKHAELDFERSTTTKLGVTATLQEEIRLQQMKMATDMQEMRCGMTRQNELIYQLGASVLRFLAEKPVHHSFDTQEQPRIEQEKLETLAGPELLATIQSSAWFADERSRVVSIPTPENKPASSVNTIQRDILPPRAHKFDKQEILDLLDPITSQYARHIQRIVNEVTRASRAPVTEATRRRIEIWTTNRHSDKLWMQGPYERTHPSQNTFTAVCLVALANNNNIPCLSYFCSLGVHGTAEALHLTSQDMLMDMVKSFIVQLLILLPDDLEAGPDVSRSRVEQLLNPDLDVEKAMLLFRDLHALAPPYMHCVIDAAQELEDRNDLPHTQSLYRVLRTIFNNHRKPIYPTVAQVNVLKACITTDGYADVLAVLTERGYIEKLEAAESEELLSEDGPGLFTHLDQHDDGS